MFIKKYLYTNLLSKNSEILLYYTFRKEERNFKRKKHNIKENIKDIPFFENVPNLRKLSIIFIKGFY